MIERDEREWSEADDLGGFAFGTTSGVRTRRYRAPHAANLHDAEMVPPASRAAERVTDPGLEP
jgi:hypothetical protein